MKEQPVKEKQRILLVEDDNFLGSLCAIGFMAQGFDMFTAVNGEEALEEIDKFKPDLVLLDILLPGIDGFEVLSSIRKHQDAKIKTVPVIVLSNFGEEEKKERAKELGANDYLIKTHFTVQEIIERVREYLLK